MDNDLLVQVKKLVDDLFSEKEEANIRRRTEEELEKAATTISDLTTSLEQKNQEFSEMENLVLEKDGQIETLKSELEAAKKEVEIASENLSKVEKDLDETKKDMASEKRMVELVDAGVARSDKSKQMEKVREMSDEEFASYKEELVSIRDIVVKELEKAKEQQANTQEEVIDKDDKEESASEEEDFTPPANIDKEQAAQASLNLEDKTLSVEEKYKELGKQMAQKWVKK